MKSLLLPAALLATAAVWAADVPGPLLRRGDLAYYSSFDTGDLRGLQPEGGIGTWETDGIPRFSEVSAGDLGLDVTFAGWTDEQNVLPVDTENWTLAFRARTGTAAQGLLFAFGTKNDGKGGLAFRRGAEPCSLEVTVGNKTGAEEALLKCAAPQGATDTDDRLYVLTCSNRALTLWAEGEKVNANPVTVDGALTLLAPQFQWGTRHANPMSGETKAVGALMDYIAVWKATLSAEQIKMLTAPTDAPAEGLGPLTFSYAPEGWLMPTAGKRLTAAGKTIELEKDETTHQVLGPYAANVAEVSSVSGNAPIKIFGIQELNHVIDNVLLSRSVRLKVNGGNYDLIVGGQDNYWRNGDANSLRGNLLTEVGGDASANYVIGAVYGVSGGLDTDAYALHGDSCVVVSGTARVKGSVFGRSFPIHGKLANSVGNSEVRILSLQDTTDAGLRLNKLNNGGYIVGGSAVGDGQDRGTGILQRGNTSVTVDLTKAELPATPEERNFVKHLIGGTFSQPTENSKYNFCIEGNTSVTVKVQSEVLFSGDIIGASYSSGTKAWVTGDSTVTLEGGTYAGRIIAGGCGRNTALSGKATLILNGASFKEGSQLLPSSVATVGSSELRLMARANSLENTLVGPFDRAVLAEESRLILGTTRMPNVPLEVDGNRAMLMVKLTPEEQAARRAVLCQMPTLPAGLQVATSPNGWTSEVLDGHLVLNAPEETVSWSGGADASWADGLPGFQALFNVDFGPNEAPATVRLTEPVTAKRVTVAGDYILQPQTDGQTLTVDGIRVEAGASLTFAQPQPPMVHEARYVKFSPLSRPTTGNNADGVALAELELTLAGVRDPALATATVTSTQASNNNNTHLIEHIIDNNLGTKWYWGGAPTTFEDCDIVLDAGEGKAFHFDRYRLGLADQNGRHPTSWRLSVSNDGNTWMPVESQSHTDAEANAWGANLWLDTTVLTRHRVGDLTVAGTLAGTGDIAGAVTFDGDVAVLKVNPASEECLTVRGTLSGTVRVDGVAGLVCRLLNVASAQEGFALIAPDGYRAVYADGAYWALKLTEAPYTATADGPVSLSDASIWSDANGPLEDFRLLTLLPREERRIVLKGTSDTAEFSGTSVLEVNAVSVEGTVRLAPGGLSLASLKVPQGASLTAVNCVLPTDTVIDGSLTYVCDTAEQKVAPLKGSGTVTVTGTRGIQMNSGWGTPALTVLGGCLHGSVNGQMKMQGSVTMGKNTELLLDAPDTGLDFADGTVLTLCTGAKCSLINGRGWKSGSKIRGGRLVLDAPGGEVILCGTSYGNSSDVQMPISGEGTLVFTQAFGNNAWTVSGAVADAAPDRKLAVRIRPPTKVLAQKLTLSGANTFTGGFVVEPKSVITLANGAAVGCGDVVVGAGASMTVNGTPLTVASGHALKLVGTLAGTAQIRFADGAALDITEGLGKVLAADAETFAGRLTVKARSEQVTPEGMKLFTGADAVLPTAVDVVAPSAYGTLEKRADGLYLVQTAAPEPPAGPEVILPGGTEAAPDTVTAVTEALKALGDAAAGVKMVTVKPAEGLSQAQAEGALAVFGSAAADIAVAGETATATVRYTFAITAIVVADGRALFTATATAGGQPANLVPGAKVRILKGETVLETKETMPNGTVTFNTALEAGAPLYKVEAFKE